MKVDGDRRYLSTHPWITLGFKMDRLSPATWALLGEAAAKCEHLAGSAMAPEFARELNQVSLERGAHGTTSIEGNSLSEDEVRAIVRGESRIPPSRAYQKQEIENIVGLFNDIARDCLEGYPAPLSPERFKEQHARLMVGQPEKEDVVPGEFRTHDVVVGRYRGAPSGGLRLPGPQAVRLAQWRVGGPGRERRRAARPPGLRAGGPGPPAPGLDPSLR